MPDETEPATTDASQSVAQRPVAAVPVLTTFQQPETSAQPETSEPTSESTANAPVAASENARVDAFLADLDTRLRHSGHGVSGDVRVRLVFEQPGLIAFDAADVQTALHAASAAMAAGGEDGREWTFVGSGPDLESGRIRAYVRVNPAP